MTIGDTVYLKWRGYWTEFTLQHLHDWQSTCTITNGNGEHTCKLSELLTKEAYDRMVYNERREELRQLYHALIEAYGSGPEKPGERYRTKHTKAVAAKLGREARSVGNEIARAKKWGLIKDDKEPSAKSGAESSGSECERPSGLPADS